MDNMHVQLATSVPKPANKKKTTKCVVIVSLQKKGLSQRFQNHWDSPKKRWDRVKIPIPVFFFPTQ